MNKRVKRVFVLIRLSIIQRTFIARDEPEEDRLSARAVRRARFDLEREEEDAFDAHEMAARLKERHRRRPLRMATDTAIPAVLQLADVNEPNMWVVRCKPGKEKDIVLTLMRRVSDAEQYGGSTSKIFSASCRDSLKGYVYIEARKLADVQAAVQNVNNVFATKIQLVPVDERADVIVIKSKRVDLKPNSWVKIKKGRNAGELAQVVDISETGDSARVKLVAKKDDPLSGDKRKKPAHANNYKRGYIERDVKISNLIVDDVSPSVDEITAFAAAQFEEGATIATLAIDSPLTAAIKTDFQPGDIVEVVDGGEAGLYGTVDVVELGMVTFTVSPDINSGALQKAVVEASRLRKKFSQGDHVKVLNGKHKDATGMVLEVKGTTVTLVLDDTMEEAVVFSKDVKRAADATKSVTSESKYELHEFVQLFNGTYGIIVGIERGSYRILSDDGIVRSVEAVEISRKLDTRRAQVKDSHGNTLQQGDLAQETIREMREGKILHIFKHTAFLLSRDVSENGGVFFTRWKSLINKNSTTTAPKLDQINPAVYGNRQLDRSQGQNRGFNNRGYGERGGYDRMRGKNGRGRGRGRGRKDHLIDQTVTIVKGPYKGYMGIVKDTTETMARVELHTDSRILNVEKAKLMMKDSSGIIRPIASDFQPRERDLDTSSNYGASSPYSPSGWSSSPRTPSWAGSRTPAYSSAMTPNPHADGSRTPAIHSMNDGSQTPAWDIGSKTPAWIGGSSDGSPRWGDGGLTPRWNDISAPTPAPETPRFSAPTPAPVTPNFLAATPAADGPNFVPTPKHLPPTTPEPMTPGLFVPATPHFIPATPMAAGGDYADGTLNSE
ncbi:3134_t:CDS:10 [Paraglomus occultum]|uniref:Transcription elongation factor SPT5 n=1 Tax=Paraglomus occultum TaxID=144539 RepID=A0A9N8WAY3_9GLOM|nr:3134_t:CDS:10 [Paraglomus occultum]